MALLFPLSFALLDDANLAIDMLNRARQVQGVKLLTWSPDLAAYAQF